MNSYAVVSNTTGLVKTFIRSDLTHGYPPPEGYSLMPDDSLPEGWQREPLVVEVPESVRAAQLRQWLIDKNLDELVEAKLSSSDNWPDIKTWKKAKARYEYEPLVNRNDPLVESLGLDLGMTDSQMDDAFITMSQIQ